MDALSGPRLCRSTSARPRLRPAGHRGRGSAAIGGAPYVLSIDGRLLIATALPATRLAGPAPPPHIPDSAAPARRRSPEQRRACDDEGAAAVGLDDLDLDPITGIDRVRGAKGRYGTNVRPRVAAVTAQLREASSLHERQRRRHRTVRRPDPARHGDRLLRRHSSPAAAARQRAAAPPAAPRVGLGPHCRLPVSPHRRGRQA
jgi:hypothetical protein